MAEVNLDTPINTGSVSSTPIPETPTKETEDSKKAREAKEAAAKLNAYFSNPISPEQIKMSEDGVLGNLYSKVDNLEPSKHDSNVKGLISRFLDKFKFEKSKNIQTVQNKGKDEVAAGTEAKITANELKNMDSTDAAATALLADCAGLTGSAPQANATKVSKTEIPTTERLGELQAKIAKGETLSTSELQELQTGYTALTQRATERNQTRQEGIDSLNKMKQEGFNPKGIGDIVAKQEAEGSSSDVTNYTKGKYTEVTGGSATTT